MNSLPIEITDYLCIPCVDKKLLTVQDVVYRKYLYKAMKRKYKSLGISIAGFYKYSNHDYTSFFLIW